MKIDFYKEDDILVIDGDNKEYNIYEDESFIQFGENVPNKFKVEIKNFIFVNNKI